MIGKRGSVRGRAWLFIAAAFVALGVGGATPARAQPPATQPDAIDLLRMMMKAEKQVSFRATETVVQRDAPPLRMNVWRQGVKRRIEWLSPPVRVGDTLVDDGTNIWLYHHRENSAVQTKSLGQSSLENVDIKAVGNRAHVTGSATVAGRAAWIVEIEPHGADGRLRRLWIDQQTHIRLRGERYAPSGQRISLNEMENVHFGAVPASQFDWSPSGDTAVTRTTGKLFMQLDAARRAAPWLQYPHVMPQGYSFESAVVDKEKGEAWLRYTDGLHRFSIFQQRALESAGQGTVKEPRPVSNGWYWQGGGSRMLGVGIPAPDASQVIRSIR